MNGHLCTYTVTIGAQGFQRFDPNGAAGGAPNDPEQGCAPLQRLETGSTICINKTKNYKLDFFCGDQQFLAAHIGPQDLGGCGQCRRPGGCSPGRRSASGAGPRRCCSGCGTAAFCHFHPYSGCADGGPGRPQVGAGAHLKELLLAGETRPRYRRT